VSDDPVDRPLTDRQERFVVEFLATANGAEAARRAGYSEHTAKEIASENLTKPNVKAAIDRKRTEIMADSEDKVQWLVERLTAEATDGGNNDSTRVRALEVLGKVYGAFAPEKTEVTTYSASFLADLDLDETEADLPPMDIPGENNDLQQH
jgi:phage terminase small subunit